MFLATTALTEFWDTTDEVLVLGPWCLRYDRREVWEGVRHRVVPNPWRDSATLQAAEEYCERVINTLVAHLTVCLNLIHGKRYSERYWRILLGPWLLYYVHALYDRYVSLRSVLESFRGVRTTVLSPSGYATPVDTSDFVRLTNGGSADLFNLQLYSQVLTGLGFDSAIWKEVTLPDAGGNSGAIAWSTAEVSWTPGRLARRSVDHVVMALIRLVQPRVVLGHLELNCRESLGLVRAMAFHGSALPCPRAVRYPVWHRDAAMRNGLSDIPTKDEFTSVLVQTLPVNFPMVYLEGYESFRESCLKAWRRPPAVLISSSSWYFDEAFKFLAAEFGERGSRLVGVQQGGGYGTSRLIPVERYETSIADRWFSFGWGDEQGNRLIRALPHPRFLPLAARDRHPAEKPTGILLVTTSHPRYVPRFESNPVGQFEAILDWRRRFIRALPSACRARLVVRVWGEHHGWCQVQRLEDACGSLRFDEGKRSLRQVLGHARAVIVEYLGSAYLEVLAANVPTVLFWDPQLWEVRDEANPYFERLREIGVLWDSPEAAAAKVAEVYGDPWAWWSSEAVQQVRRSFVDRHALGRTDWLDCWVRALQQEVALSQMKGE